MKIVVNTQLLLPHKLDGIGWFTYETLQRITARHPEHEFILIFDRKPSPELKFPSNTQLKILHPQSRHPFLWFLRFEVLLPFYLKKLKADIFVSPDGWMTTSTSVPCLQVIHDINFAHHPKDIPFWTRHYYNKLFPRYAKKAKRIATVSQYSKNDIVKTYGIQPEKIDVTPNGCNTGYKPTTPEQQQETRQQFTGGNPYFLYVGALIPRKNIARMFVAFDQFKKRDPQNTKLVIVGKKKWWTREISETYENMKFRDDVLFLGRQKSDGLRQLYAASVGLVFVPYFEGFGIPILEAFNCETAVITSNVTSMPEVAGDAALLTDPYSVDSIAEAMTNLSNDVKLREGLIEKARKRRELFSWDITAEKLWECIARVADEGNKS